MHTRINRCFYPPLSFTVCSCYFSTDKTVTFCDLFLFGPCYGWQQQGKRIPEACNFGPGDVQNCGSAWWYCGGVHWCLGHLSCWVAANLVTWCNMTHWGDAILCIYGAPVVNDKHATVAVMAAVVLTCFIPILSGFWCVSVAEKWNLSFKVSIVVICQAEMLAAMTGINQWLARRSLPTWLACIFPSIFWYYPLRLDNFKKCVWRNRALIVCSKDFHSLRHSHWRSLSGQHGPLGSGICGNMEDSLHVCR